MATLLFIPRTTIDANIFQYRLDNSPFHAEWNIRTGAYEFNVNEKLVDDIIYYVEQEITYDINVRFEFKN